jgi:hypothetical protein
MPCSSSTSSLSAEGFSGWLLRYAQVSPPADSVLL